MRIHTVSPEQRKPLPSRYKSVGQQRGERDNVNDYYDYRYIWNERHTATLELIKRAKREVSGPDTVKNPHFRAA